MPAFGNLNNTDMETLQSAGSHYDYSGTKLAKLQTAGAPYYRKPFPKCVSRESPSL